jgi:hypothetical protein
MAAVTFAEAGEAGTALEVRGMDVERKSPRVSQFDRLMAAVTFAEAGEGRTALDVAGMNVERKAARVSKFDRLMTAVTFAEVGEARTALDITGQRQGKAVKKRIRRENRSRVDHRPRLMA